MLFQLEGLGECLAANLTDWRHLAGVFAHVVQEVLPLAEHVSTGVALVLNLAGVDGNVLLEALQAGKLTVADGAHKITVLVLHSIVGLGRNLI